MEISSAVFDYISELNSDSEIGLNYHNYGQLIRENNLDNNDINTLAIRDRINFINSNQNNIFSIQLYKVLLTNMGNYNDEAVLDMADRLNNGNGNLTTYLNEDQRNTLRANYIKYSIIAIHSLISEVSLFAQDLNQNNTQDYFDNENFNNTI